MKARKSFISNSSSTSFILEHPEDFETARRFGMEIYRAADLLNTVEELRKHVEGSVPEFMRWGICLHFDYEQDLRKLVERNPEAHITDAYDRDLAYENDIDLPPFVTDL